MDINKKNIKARGKRGSIEKKICHIEFMQENKNFAHERFEGDCGPIGGARKNPEQWKQYWGDNIVSTDTTILAAEEKRCLEESGVNGVRKFRCLDDIEKRVLAIITPDVVDGDGDSQERGLNRPTIFYRDVMHLTPPEGVILPESAAEKSHAEESVIPMQRETPRLPKRRKKIFYITR